MIGDVANHLWQSTVFAVAAGLLTVAFRRNQPSVRYWIWFSASVKFFIPFTLLISLGSQLEWAPAAQQIAAPAVTSTVVQISQPFVDARSPGVPAAPAMPRRDWIGVAVLAVWICGVGTIALTRFRGWRRIRAAVHAGTPWATPDLATPRTVQVRTTPGLMEPGVVGVWRPTLLMPVDIEDHLTPCQLEAVLAHELCHVRRRDNLTAAIHMIVEAVFWFHPLVWWIGARLVDERERACDEEVLRVVGDPQVYAEGILNVCKRYAEAPLVCVSGVSGANLRRRIEGIMLNRIGLRLNVGRRIGLAVAAVVALALPVAVGAMGVPAVARAETQAPGATPGQLAPQSPIAPAADLAFEVASIRPNTSGSTASRSDDRPDGSYTATNMPLRSLILYAYGLHPSTDRGRVVGGPAWIDSERFDITARAPENASPGQVWTMLRALLADRFKLVARMEMREAPVYALVLARAGGTPGPQMTPSSLDCSRPGAFGSSGGVVSGAGAAGLTVTSEKRCGTVSTVDRSGGLIRGGARSIADLAMTLSARVDRPVVDRTGLTGSYDFEIRWTPDNLRNVEPDPSVPRSASNDGTDFFTAVQEQLGLRLQSDRGPVEFLVIDSVERPTPN